MKVDFTKYTIIKAIILASLIGMVFRINIDFLYELSLMFPLIFILSLIFILIFIIGMIVVWAFGEREIHKENSQEKTNDRT